MTASWPIPRLYRLVNKSTQVQVACQRPLRGNAQPELEPITWKSQLRCPTDSEPRHLYLHILYCVQYKASVLEWILFIGSRKFVADWDAEDCNGSAAAAATCVHRRWRHHPWRHFRQSSRRRPKLSWSGRRRQPTMSDQRHITWRPEVLSALTGCSCSNTPCTLLRCSVLEHTHSPTDTRGNFSTVILNIHLYSP